MTDGGGTVELAIELDTVESAGVESNFKSRFKTILTGFTWYPEDSQLLDNDDADTDAIVRSYDEAETIKQRQETEKQEERQKWWEAVQETVREDTDLFEKVQKKCKEALSTGVEWENIVQGVLTDVMLEMEGLEPSEAFVYIFKQEFTFFPTLFLLQEMLSREASLKPESENEANSVVHLAVRTGRVEYVEEIVKGREIAFFLLRHITDEAGYPILHEAVIHGNEEMFNLLVENGGGEKKRDKENRTVLHVVAEYNRDDLVWRLASEEDTAEFAAQDNNGRIPLHQAVISNSVEVAEVLVQRGSPVNIQDAKGQTPLHIAVEKQSKYMMDLLLYYKADVGIADHNNETPLTLATTWQEGFQYLLNHCYEGEGSEAPKMALKQALEKKKDKVAAEKIKALPHSEVVKMLQHYFGTGQDIRLPQEHELKFSFINHFVDDPSMKRSTLAILDHFVLANTCVNSEVMESDTNGYPPDHVIFENQSKSFLSTLSDHGIKDIALHPAVTALMDHKWNSFGRWLFLLIFVLYLLRMVVFGAALFIAARPDLDNPGCYRDGWDYARGIFEGISLIFFLYKGYDEISEMFQYQKAYFRDHYNYLQIASVLLPLLIIPFRAATTWCASTGEGYCALPVNSTTMGNMSFSESCIVASSVQWIVASFAYLVNAMLIVEYIALFRLTGVYVRILLKILASDMIKFMVIFLVVLYIFVGTFYLALRAGVVISADGQIKSDVQLFALETLYPWHVLFTGFRILFEASSVLDNYFALSTTTGLYIGYQWFSILLYLVFLFVVIIILLNLLIAQMSNTYATIQGEAEGTYAVARARVLARLEKSRFFGFGEPLRKKYYSQILWNYDPTESETERDEKEERLLSLEKKVDSLTKMMTEIYEFHQTEREKKDAMLAFTLPEAPTTPVDDSDSDD